MHGGTAPRYTPEQWAYWISGELWSKELRLSPEQFRVCLVYYSKLAISQRTCGINFNTPAKFGNQVPHSAHRDVYRNLVKDGAHLWSSSQARFTFVQRELAMSIYDSSVMSGPSCDPGDPNTILQQFSLAHGPETIKALPFREDLNPYTHPQQLHKWQHLVMFSRQLASQFVVPINRIEHRRFKARINEHNSGIRATVPQKHWKPDPAATDFAKVAESVVSAKISDAGHVCTFLFSDLGRSDEP